MTHKLKIGQIVDLATRGLIPASDRDPEDPRYRIKSTVEKYERVAPESDLTVSASVFA